MDIPPERPHNNKNNNNNTIGEGSVLNGEEPPPHSGELNHALSHVGGPTQSQLSRPLSSRHHISMEHRLRKKHLLLNPDTNARKEKTNTEKHSKKKKKKKTRSKKKEKEEETKKGEKKGGKKKRGLKGVTTPPRREEKLNCF